MGHLAYITRQGSYSKRDDLVTVGWGNMPDWAKQQPMLLWKASDMHERNNGSTYRSFTISLPNVLSIDQLIDLAWAEAELLAGLKPFHFALHMPHSSLQEELNPHIHVAICDRVPDGFSRTPEQMFRRYNPTRPDLGGCRKDSGGLTRLQLRDQIIAQRKAVADTMNDHLRLHGHSVRVDHRSLREQGKERAPEKYLGPKRIRLMSADEKIAFLAERAGHTEETSN